MNRTCSDDCHTCDLADPWLCRQFAEMTHETHKIRYCRECDERAWHDERVVSDGAGNGVMVDVWFCPRCKRVFG